MKRLNILSYEQVFLHKILVQDSC